MTAPGSEGTAPAPPGQCPHDDPERMIFFSDAVFAIAMTLLAFDLGIPDLVRGMSRPEFEAALVARVPAFIAFITSFCVLAGAWLTHHNRMRDLRRYDTRLQLLNLTLLLFVALTPVPTSMVFAPTGDSPWAPVLYALVLGPLYLVLELEWVYAHRHGFLDAETGDAAYRRRVGATLPVALVFLTSIPVALLAGARWATFWWVLCAPASILVVRLRRRRAARAAAPATADPPAPTPR